MVKVLEKPKQIRSPRKRLMPRKDSDPGITKGMELYSPSGK
jgi:hypothetical protein